MKHDNHSTGATCTFTVGLSEFHFEVFTHFRDFGFPMYYVLVKQVTDMSEFGEDDFYMTYKINAVNCATEHSAIHYAGKKLIKNWNRYARIGKDHPVKDPVKDNTDK